VSGTDALMVLTQGSRLVGYAARGNGR
jgi:hypothetical protein